MTLTDGEYISVRINAGPRLPSEGEPLDGEYPLFYKTEGDAEGSSGLYIAKPDGTWRKAISTIYYAESDGESSTNSTSWQIKLTYAVEEGGDYLVSWTFEFCGSSTSYHCCSQVLHNTNEIANLQYEPEDTLPAPWTSGAGFKRLSLSEGDTIKINYCSENAGATTYIRFARISLLRT